MSLLPPLDCRASLWRKYGHAGRKVKPPLEGLEANLLFQGLIFKVASGEDKLRACELQHAVYSVDLGHVPNDAFEEGALYLIACAETTNEVVATFRLVGPDQRPFDLERVVDLDALIGANRMPALVGRLCVRPDYRRIRRGTFLQIGMLKLAYSFALKNGITDLVMYTYPRLRNFYRTALFRPLDCNFVHPDWGMVEVMHLDLLNLRDRYAESSDPVASLLLASDLPNFIV